MFNFSLKERKNLKVLDLTRFQSSSRNNIYLLGSYTLLFLALKLNLIRKFNETMALKDNNLTHVMADHGFMRLGAKWNDARTEEYLFWFIIIGKARAFEQNNRSWASRMKAKKLHEIFG